MAITLCAKKRRFVPRQRLFVFALTAIALFEEAAQPIRRSESGSQRRFLRRRAVIHQARGVERANAPQKTARRLVNLVAPRSVKRSPRRPSRRQLGRERNRPLMRERLEREPQFLRHVIEVDSDLVQRREEIDANRLRSRALSGAPSIELVERAERHHFDVVHRLLDAPRHVRRRHDDDAPLDVRVRARMTQMFLMLVRAMVSHAQNLRPLAGMTSLYGLCTSIPKEVSP